MLSCHIFPQVLPFHMYDPSFRNVAKFTFGLLEDDFELAELICARFYDDIGWFVHNSEQDFVRIQGQPDTERIWKTGRLDWKRDLFLHLIKDIAIEKPNSPVIQVRNGTIFLQTNNRSVESGLVYIAGSMRIRINKSNSVEIVNEGKSDIIFLEWESGDELLKVLQECHRPLQVFYLDSPIIPEVKSPAPVPVSPIQFTENACVEIRYADFGDASLKVIVDGIQNSDTLQKIVLHGCQSLPKALVATLQKMRNLSVLQIKQCRLPDELSQILCNQVRHLEKLEMLSLAYSLSSSVDMTPLLGSLAKFPLRKLDLSGINLTWNIDRAWKVPGIHFSHLERLFLDSTGLNESDLSTIMKLISEKAIPKLHDLSVLFIDFRKLSHPICGLLQSCDENLDFCTVWISSWKLPEHFNRDRFNCFRSPRENVSYDYAFEYHYYDGEDEEFDYEYDYTYD